MRNMIHTLSKNPIMPVAIIERAADAVPLAEALIKGGIKQIEVTFRTPVAAECIVRMRQAVPEMVICAGTILTARGADVAYKLHVAAAFAPGFDTHIIERADELGLFFIPGIASPSELMLALRFGYKLVKFFPAEGTVGLQSLHSLNGAFAHTGVRFVPASANIDDRNVGDYIAIPNVLCVATSWLCPRTLINSGNFAEITERAERLLAAVENAKPVQPRY